VADFEGWRDCDTSNPANGLTPEGRSLSGEPWVLALNGSARLDAAQECTGGRDCAGVGQAFEPDVRLESLTYGKHSVAVPLSADASADAGGAAVADGSPQSDAAVAPPPEAPADRAIAADHPSSPNDEPCAAMLMRLASEARIIQGLDNRFYAEIPADGHHEIHELGSPAFEYWLIRSFRRHRQTLPSLDGLKRLIRALEADAMAAGPAEAVWVRVAGGTRHTGSTLGPAQDGQGHIRRGYGSSAVFYLDLADSSREAVEIRAEGCRLVTRPPVLFRRPRGLHPLPKPCWDGSIELLKKYTNVADADFPLLVAWMTAALRPVGPYPILILSGEQGSAKSTMARVARRLIDPSSAPLRALPGNQRDFMIEAHNTWVLAYDNVSTISTALSDGLCRIATGGGFSTRALFTDHDNTLLDVQRPVIFTGIDEFVHRSDLIDRCIFLHLPTIADERRRLEQEFWEEFEADYPRLLGALLTAVSAGLRLRSAVEITTLPRMADFAQWGEAVSRGLGWEAGSFLSQYKANRREACSSALGDCPVAEALRGLLDYFASPVEETASELLSLLGGCAPPPIRRSAQWPKNARALSVVLRRIAPQLRMIGIIVKFGLGPNGRLLSISSDECEDSAQDSAPGANPYGRRNGNNA